MLALLATLLLTATPPDTAHVVLVATTDIGPVEIARGPAFLSTRAPRSRS